jgi:hypothetical protein
LIYSLLHIIFGFSAVSDQAPLLLYHWLCKCVSGKLIRSPYLLTYIQTKIYKTNVHSLKSEFATGLTKFKIKHLTWRVPLVEQELLTFPAHLISSPGVSEVRVTRSLVLCVCFDRCLSFCPFSFGHCVICLSSIYGFWLPPFGIFKLFLVSSLCQIVLHSLTGHVMFGVSNSGYGKIDKKSFRLSKNSNKLLYHILLTCGKYLDNRII